MEKAKHILIVEDDESILFGLQDILEGKGYKISTASNGIDGLKLASTKPIDLLVLDIMLPGKNGLEICKRIRKEKIKLPIIMLTAKSSEIDKISGLDYGADDYITKPFSLSELLARIRSILRRTYPEEAILNNFSFGQVTVDFTKMKAIVDDREVKFTKKEFAILEYFIKRDGEVVPRHDLLNNIWGYDKAPTTRTVDTFILEIRKKIEETPSSPKHIVSISGVGYRFISGNL
jgi:DNA-binding response OmpR family regulator